MSDFANLSSTRFGVKKENLKAFADALVSSFGDYSVQDMTEPDEVVEDTHYFSLAYSEDVGDSFPNRVDIFSKAMAAIAVDAFEIELSMESDGGNDDRQQYFYGGPNESVNVFANACVTARALDLIRELKPSIQLEEDVLTDTLTIGYQPKFPSSAVGVVFATLDNSDGHLDPVEFAKLAEFVACCYDRDGQEKVQVFSEVTRPAIANKNEFIYTDDQLNQVSHAFLINMESNVGKKKYQQIQTLNSLEPDPNICHSHDFVDANMVMAKAFEQVMGEEPDVQNDKHTGLWNKAWDLAKESMATTFKAAQISSDRSGPSP